MSIKITADSTCDLSAELVQAYDIGIVPLYIVKDGKDYKDGIEITPDDIFDYVEKTGNMCSTAAVNALEYEEIFRDWRDKYDGVIHISISAEFSSCYQSAVTAAENLDNVRVVDSRNLSTGSGLVVLKAAELAREGLSLDEICQQLNQFTGRVEASFVLNKLDYLKKGGRCSSLAALGANLLKLKPCIEVRNGKMQVGKKYQSSFEKCLKKYVKDRLCDRDDIDYSRIFITHCACKEEMVNMVREAVCEYANFEEILMTTAGCTVSSHCGPETLGILFVRSK